jgi:hypothetical protein
MDFFSGLLPESGAEAAEAAEARAPRVMLVNMSTQYEWSLPVCRSY